MRSSRRSLGWAAAALGAALFAAGCPQQQAGDEPVVLETEDVGPALDEELDLSTDRKAAPRSRTGGKLPGGFPEGLPLYPGATISDLGQDERGDFVEFKAPADSAKVRAWYPAALARGGWSVEGGPGGAMVVARDRRRARISIQASDPVTFIRVEY